MLILSRKIGERIIIGTGKNKVVISVLNILGQQSKLGIEAPKTISVHRKEVFEKIQFVEQSDIDSE